MPAWISPAANIPTTRTAEAYLFIIPLAIGSIKYSRPSEATGHLENPWCKMRPLISTPPGKDGRNGSHGL
jgi:hypothetical protein